MTEEETLESPPETQSEINTPENVPAEDVSSEAVSSEAAVNGPDAIEAAKLQRRTKLWRLFFIVVLVAFVWFLAVGLLRTNKSEQRASGDAPTFEFTTFEGETISLEDLAGKGVVLNFWASWCEPCRAEAALLESTWRREAGGDIVFLGLDYLDQEHAALEYLAEFDVTYPNGPDKQSAAARTYGIKGVPETFFIGPDGLIISHVIGPVMSQADLNRRLDEIRP
jgi:cytochrome c biogenesis protein CcmG/thiol:disulfide interchange protein DsbE